MFDPDTLYMNGDEALKGLARPSTWNHWRSQGEGPPYIKIGARVGYRGSDLNRWLESRTIQPTQRPAA